MNYYKRHLGDLAKSCSHLSQGAMGAYDLLIDWIYSNEKPLPKRLDDLYQIGRARTKGERDNVDRVLEEFFTETETGFTQKRIGKELDKYHANAETNRQIALEREAKKRAQKEHDQSTNRATDRCTNDQPSQNPESIKEQEHESPIGDSSADKPADAPCPQQAIVALYHEILPELRRVREWNETRQRLLSRRWRESRERQSLDWWRQFFGYVRKSDFLMGRTTGRDGRPFDCDLEWLIRPTNFAKVVEGKYEDMRA